jgi:hypothetical protein
MKAGTIGIVVALLSTAAAIRRRATRFGLVLRWVLALSFITPCLEARAEVTYLSCSGTVRMIRVGILSPEQPSTFSISVDVAQKTIIVDDYEPVPLVGNPSINPIVFGLFPQTTVGVRSGYTKSRHGHGECPYHQRRLAGAPRDLQASAGL